jgi:hypothetical protein
VIDACRPFHWKDQFPEVNYPSPEDKALAMRKFGHLFEN